MASAVLRGDRNQCPGCREYFNSTAAFDRHRTGRFGVDRRCRSAAEMAAAGMTRTAAGFWVARPWPEAWRSRTGATRAPSAGGGPAPAPNSALSPTPVGGR